MIRLAQNETQAMLMQLERAIYNHTKWYESLVRGLICHLPYERGDVAPNAHRHCRFGQWYYSVEPEKLRVNPGFVAIETEHRNLHRLTAKLLRSAASGAIVSTLEFDSFNNALERLRLEIYTLKHELEDSLITIDPLTGADNRIGMLPRLREQHDMVMRGVQACSIAMMDLDHFKNVNDTYGHAAGDQVLMATAGYVMEHFRPYDKLFRYGGEEFLVCMQNTNVTAAREIVERVREGVAATPIDYGGTTPLRITVSFGLTQLEPDASVEQSIERADKAMYAAKNAGRNCTRIWDPAM